MGHMLTFVSNYSSDQYNRRRMSVTHMYNGKPEARHLHREPAIGGSGGQGEIGDREVVSQKMGLPLG